ncbi:MAG: hypothetical protein QM770_05495 [Tepidisphaeraceae bacterium]
MLRASDAGVQDEARHHESNEGDAAKEDDHDSPATAPTTRASEIDPAAPTPYPKALAKAEPFLTPLQTHLWLAGLATALMLVSVAASMRAVTEPAPILPPPYSVDPAVQRIGDAFNPKPLDNTLPVAAARTWGVTILAAVLTLLFGAWILASDTDSLSPRAMLELVKLRASDTDPWLTRRLAHVILGTALIALPVLMAILARVARRSGLTVLLIGTLVLLAVLAQAWVGVLLLLDSPAGTIWRLN